MSLENYISSRTINPSDTLTFSFDVNSDKMLMIVGLCDENNNTPLILKITTNVNEGKISEIIENTLNFNSGHENNTFCGEYVIIETNEQNSGIKVDNSFEPLNLINFDENYNYIFDNKSQTASLENAENGSVIFFLTNSPKSENYVSYDLGTFEERDNYSHEIIPLILAVDDDCPLLETYDENFISFIELGNEVIRDYSLCPTTIYETLSDNETNQSYLKEYQVTNDIIPSSYRARFVISNNARMISFSIYNNQKLLWENVKTVIANIENLKGEYHIVFSTDKPSSISNITANF